MSIFVSVFMFLFVKFRSSGRFDGAIWIVAVLILVQEKMYAYLTLVFNHLTTEPKA